MMQHLHIAAAAFRVRQDVRVEVPCPPDPVEGGPDRHGVGEVVPGPPSFDLRNAIDRASSDEISQIDSTKDWGFTTGRRGPRELKKLAGRQAGAYLEGLDGDSAGAGERRGVLVAHYAWWWSA
jgi:hypothetical protein